MSEPLDEPLNQLKDLLKQYHEASDVLHQHHSDEQFHRLTDQLREKIMHLEAISHESYQSQKERQQDFFQHHFEAAQHANAHWNHARKHLTHAFKAEELTDLQNTLQALMQKIDSERYTAEQQHQELAQKYKMQQFNQLQQKMQALMNTMASYQKSSTDTKSTTPANHTFDTKELDELHRKIQHLTEKLEDARFEAEHKDHRGPYAGPEPNPYAPGGES